MLLDQLLSFNILPPRPDFLHILRNPGDVRLYHHTILEL